MSAFFKLIGIVVVLLVVASAGVMHGDMCAGGIGCVGANRGGITFHAAHTP